MAKLVQLLWIPVALFLLYTAWIFWQRHSGGGLRFVERDPMAMYGTHVKVFQFYGPQEIEPGAKALVCYGVVNATSVRLDPPVERVWPAVSRCFEVTPSASTRYTLTAEGKEHTSDSKTIEIAVRR